MLEWRKMRRSEKAMSKEEIDFFLQEHKVGHLATINANGYPYVIPLNYVYEGGRFIFHSAVEGEKLDNITANPKVCFEVEAVTRIVAAEKPCSFTVHYQSVVAFGKATIITGAEKQPLLERFAEGFLGKKPEGFTEEAMSKVAVIIMEVEAITGKQNK